MAVKDLIVLNETDSKLEAQQGTDTARIKGTADTLLDVTNESDVSLLRVDSSGSRVVLGGPVTMSGDFSGSLPSASFGRLEATVFSGSGRDITGVMPADSVSSSLQLSDAISGSWQGELSSSDLVFVDGGISGSSISTGSFGRFTAATYWSADGSEISNIPYGGIISSSRQISDDVSGSLLNRLSGSTSHIGEVFVGGGISSSAAQTIPGQRAVMNTRFSVTLDYVTMTTPGNATDFGDSTFSNTQVLNNATSNGIRERGIFMGSHASNTMDYITISTPGNATDFGDLTVARGGGAATSNGPNDRAVYSSGQNAANSNVNVMDYVTISSTGNATDFGDTQTTARFQAATSNGVNERGLIGPGYGRSNDVEAFTISSLGDSVLYSDLITVVSERMGTGISNGQNDRAVWAAGYHTDKYGHMIKYMSISNLATAADFGNTQRLHRESGGVSNDIGGRGLIIGSYPQSTDIEYIDIDNLGDALTFGDATVNKQATGATSNSSISMYHTSSFYAMTGSFQGDGRFLTGITVPTGLISSSVQLSSGISGSFLNEFHSGSLMGLGGGISSSAGVSSSFAHISASRFVGDGTGITYTLPSGLFSSSAQVDGASVTGSLKSALGSSDLVGWYRMGDGAQLGLSGSINTELAFSNDSTAGRQASGSGEGVWSVPDMSGHGNHAISYGTGSLTSSLALTGSHFNGSGSVSYVNEHAMTFDGAKDYFLASTPNSPNVSFAAWVKIDASVGVTNIVGGSGILGYVNVNGVDWKVYDGAAWRIGGTLTPGLWHHVAFSFVGATKTLIIYMDGVEGYNASGLGSMTYGALTTIGAYYYGLMRFWKGHIDEIAIWNRAITAPEVTALYNSGTGSLPSTIGYQSGRNEMSASVLSNQLFVSGGLKTGFSYGNAMSSSAPGQRGLSAGRDWSRDIDYVTISTRGSAIVFGTLTGTHTHGANSRGFSNGIKQRAIFCNSDGASSVNVLQYVTISTPGDATDFGDMLVAGRPAGATSNGPNDRGIIMGGRSVNIIEYVTISTTGDSTDFGDGIGLNDEGGLSNGVHDRAIGFGGPGNYGIEFVTISTTGNSAGFGDRFLVPGGATVSNANNERGIIGGSGYSPSQPLQASYIEFMTINSAGNAELFGEYITGNRSRHGGLNNATGERGLFTGNVHSGWRKIIDYITISTTGNTQDFGGLLTADRQQHGSADNGMPTEVVDSSFSRITADRFSGVGTGITNINPSGLITSSVQLKEDISGSIGTFVSTYAPHSMQFWNSAQSSSGYLPFTGSSAIANKYSFDFDGSNDYVDCGNDASIQFNGSFSISCWISTTDSAGGNRIFVSVNNDGTNEGWAFRLSGNQLNAFTWTDGAEAAVTDSTAVLNDGQWHHAVMVHESGGTFRLYKDGVLLGSVTAGNDMDEWVPNFHIGGQDLGTPRHASGKIAEVAAWNAALSSSAVAALYNGGIPTDLSSNKGSYDQSGSLKLWLNGNSASFDGSNWDIYDQSGHTNSGSSVNMTIDDRVIDTPPTMANTLEAPYPVALSGSKAATIAFWAKVGTTGLKEEYLIGDAARQGWEIRKGGTNNFQFAVLTGSSAGATASFVTDHAIPDNNSEGTSSGFAHYALTYEGGSGQIIGYVQGSGSSYGKLYETASLDFQTGSFVDTAGQGTLRFGRLTDEIGSGWLGSIAEVAIWSSSLSASAISDLAEGPFDVASKTTTNYTATSSLVSYWTVTSGSYNEDT